MTAPIKSHSILVGRFGQSVVLAGHLPATHGEAINKAQRFREIADYSGDPISLDNAEWVVEQAADFVVAVRKSSVKACQAVIEADLRLDPVIRSAFEAVSGCC